MTTDNNYAKVLREMKIKYEETLAELEAEANQVKARIGSLDVLIDDPLLGKDFLAVLQSETNSPPAKASTPKATKASKPKAGKASKPKTTTKAKKPAPTANKRKSSASKKAASQAQAKQKTQKKNNRAAPTALPMKKPYTQMLKMDAVAKIMEKEPGKIFHTDDLIFELFGELSEGDLKAERKRMKNTLYKGAQNDRWIKTQAPNSYTFGENSQTKTKESKTTQAKKTPKKA